MISPPRLGIRENLRQFVLLVVVNAFVGAMVGLERTVLPLLAAEEFGIASTSVAMSFLVAFGVTKALANLFAGRMADTVGRKRLLVIGWLVGIPVAPMIIWAPAWGWVVAANVLLGVNQGFAWSATVIMKIDLAGPRQRGLAMGLNEVAGYGAVSIVSFVSATLAAAYGPRPAPFVLGVGIAAVGLITSVAFVRETAGHAASETAGAGTDPALPPFGRILAEASFRNRTLATVSQAGLVNNLNDAMAWGLLPIFLASRGLGVGRIGVIASLYPAAWTLAQGGTGALSDRVGRKPLIVAGLLVQAAAIGMFVAKDDFVAWSIAAVGMGLGTALVYPTLLAAVGDVAPPAWRASAVGVYRLWRDSGYAIGALICGLVADALGLEAAIGTVAVITAVWAGVVAIRMEETHVWREEVGMRVIDCPCGHTLCGANDDELFALAKQHIEDDHPEMQRTDDEIRQRVAADARDD
jgi:MFS family permease